MRGGEVVFDRPTAAVTSAMLHELYATEGRALPRQGVDVLDVERAGQRRRAQAPGLPMSARPPMSARAGRPHRRRCAIRARARPRSARAASSRVVVLWPLLVLAEFKPLAAVRRAATCR